MELVLVMGSEVLLPVLVIPIIMLFIFLYELYFSLWLKPWLFFPVDDEVEYFQYLVS